MSFKDFDDVNCCERKFLQLSSNGKIATCLSCKTKIEKVTKYQCQYCNYESEQYNALDLEDNNGNTDWCSCSACNREFRYHQFIINKTTKITK